MNTVHIIILLVLNMSINYKTKELAQKKTNKNTYVKFTTSALWIWTFGTTSLWVYGNCIVAPLRGPYGNFARGP